jgi:hypothetical protein
VHATVQSEQGQLCGFDAERVPIKVNRATVGKLQQGQWFISQLRQVERTARHLKDHAGSARHGINGIADHLRAQCWELLAQCTVMHVVQGHSVPHTRALNLRGQGVAHLCKSRLQSLQPGKLLGCGVKGDANYGIHIGTDSKPSYMNISRCFEKISKLFECPESVPQKRQGSIRVWSK